MPRLSKTRLTKRIVDAALAGQCLSDSEVRGFRLIVTPKGTKRFVVSYQRDNGKSSMMAIGSYPTLTVDEAREAAREVLGTVRKGIDPVKAKKELREAPAVIDLYRLYVDDYAQSQALREKTVKDARSVLQPALKAIGNEKVAEVTKAQIRKLHGDVRAAGIKNGNKGVYRANRLLAALSKMFSLGIERGWLENNPCKGLKKFPEDQRRRYLDEDEVARLFAACQAYVEQRPENHFALEAVQAIQLLLYTGSRLQEVLKAEWGQFDLERGVWEKPSSHTKTKIQQWMELEGPALDLLRGMSASARDSRFLFPGQPKKGQTAFDEGKPRADLKKPWEWIKREAGLEGVRLHDIRRTTASFMLNMGVSLATVGKQLGHTQASTTQRYAYLAPSVQRTASKALGEAIADIARKGPAEKVVSLS